MTESTCLIVLADAAQPGVHTESPKLLLDVPAAWGSSTTGCAPVASGKAPWSLPVLLTYSYRSGLEVS
jgi:hypothetical protein